MPSPRLSLALLALCCVLSVPWADAHGYLTLPVGRAQAIWGDTKGNQNCRVHTRGITTEFQAGETIQVRHSRNNHIGGFARYALSPLGNETTRDFDNHVFYYTCRESGAACAGLTNSSRFAPDGARAHVVQCGDTITLPDWLPVGDYVLQWTWFGVGMSYGKPGLAEPQFRSCADIRLTTRGTRATPPPCPTFVGGDRVTTLENRGSDTCFYFHANDIVDAIFETEDYESEYKFGIPAPVAKCRAALSGDEGSVAGEGDEDETQRPATPEPSAAATLGPTPTKRKDCGVKNAE